MAVNGFNGQTAHIQSARRFQHKAHLQSSQCLVLSMPSSGSEDLHLSAGLLHLGLQACHGMLVVGILPVLCLPAVLQACFQCLYLQCMLCAVGLQSMLLALVVVVWQHRSLSL